MADYFFPYRYLLLISVTQYAVSRNSCMVEEIYSLHIKRNSKSDWRMTLQFISQKAQSGIGKLSYGTVSGFSRIRDFP
jgi:hypothetical protein